tara:strand:+ start:311 stop:700 length:390 start_codon:yes stop_codon:yes gene_type:complete
MDKILVEVSAGELLDKLSILDIKKNKIDDPISLKHINNEYNILKLEYDKKVKSDNKINELYNSLKNINSKLWLIEDEKRLCEKKSDFGDNFIKLSRDVHFLNDKRAKLKLEINNYTGSNILEVKKYTSY